MSIATTTHSANTFMVPAQRVEQPRVVLAVNALIEVAKSFVAWNQARAERGTLARDAMALRAYANQIRSSEPSLAADLFAAADRAN
jgi:hypothetical protein